MGDTLQAIGIMAVMLMAVFGVLESCDRMEMQGYDRCYRELGGTR